ncbi:MAG: bifunctional glycosyltransferase family 2/GtrA family protein [Desulfovibrionaceae bacterium]|nr:bifunctional glycosyltransferase family 2/GtrA family protein [Desulfovibrionaceae bacterium]MBF0514108.1 bifunctional glycosyltransferase family 2/GtrA family protein [Desulfovibrionaceae bacterium]
MQSIVCIPAYRPTQTLIELAKNIAALRQGPIVIVDDGSGPEFATIFRAAAVIDGALVLRHAVNCGKGQALKTAFNHILLHFPDCLGVVTADADGQHLPEDVVRLCEALERSPGALTLGCRQFSRSVPWRSRAGNIISAKVFSFFLGKRISDTQTGLRAIPRAFLPALLHIQSTGYEFETEMLIRAVRNRLPLEFIPISTVYEKGNATSHFNPFLDSLKIYYVFIRFCSLSMAAAILDFSIFFLVFWMYNSIMLSSITSRCISSAFNFYTNKTIAFKSTGGIWAEAAKYFMLAAVILTISYGSIVYTVDYLGFNVYFSKIFVETILFLISFTAQNSLVFTGNAKTIPLGPGGGVPGPPSDA